MKLDVYTLAWFAAVSVFALTVAFVCGMAYQIRLHEQERSRRDHPAGSAR